MKLKVLKFQLFFIFFFLFSELSYSSENINKAENLIQESKYDSAIFYYTVEIDALTKLNNGLDLAKKYIKRSRIYEFLGNYEFAYVGYVNAEELFQKNKNYDGLVVVYTHLAELSRKNQNFDKALEYLGFAESLIKGKKISNTTLAKFYNRKAAILNETGVDEQQVIFYSKKVIELARVINDVNLEATSLNELGFVYEKKGSSSCVNYYEDAYKLFVKDNDIKNALNVLINLSRYYVANENYEKSLKYLDIAFKLYEGYDFPTVSIKMYYFQYQSFIHMGRHKEANESLKNYSATHVKNIEMEWNRSLKEVEAKYELQLKNKEIESEKNKFLNLKTKAKNESIQSNYIMSISLLMAIILIIIAIANLKIKKINRLLSSNLDQKEILLQEVHHRVKNNLTILKSLLFLQAKSSSDENVKKILNECQSRIQTMSIVHQNLYNVGDASKIDFNKFVKQLANESIRLLDNIEKRILTNINTNSIVFNMRSAVFLGLILNELINNSLKYAFNNCNEGEIIITLQETNANYTLIYSDSGASNHFKFENSKGFGFKLIKLMVSQIDGEVTYDNSKNSYTLNFSL